MTAAGCYLRPGLCILPWFGCPGSAGTPVDGPHCQRRSDRRAQGHMVRERKGLQPKIHSYAQGLPIDCAARDRSPAWRVEPGQVGGARCEDRRDCLGRLDPLS